MNITNQVKVAKLAAASVYPVAVAEEPKKSPIQIVNTYTKAFEENGTVVWYLYLVTFDEQTFKYKLDFYES